MNSLVNPFTKYSRALMHFNSKVKSFDNSNKATVRKSKWCSSWQEFELSNIFWYAYAWTLKFLQTNIWSWRDYSCFSLTGILKKDKNIIEQKKKMLKLFKLRAVAFTLSVKISSIKSFLSYKLSPVKSDEIFFWNFVTFNRRKVLTTFHKR